MDKQLLDNIPTLQHTNVAYKTVIVRLDFNVPVKDGKITDMGRIEGARRTLDYLIANKSKIVILSHFSRIKSVDDIKSGKKSLKIVADALAKMYPENKVSFATDSYDAKLPAQIKKMKSGDILLLENTRYNDVDVKSGKVVKLESKNDSALGKFWASLGEVFVNDAFATIHRGHASNAGINKNIKNKCIGYLIQDELQNIVKFNPHSTKPIVSIVGGAKIADKIILLEKLMQMSDMVLIGGGMAFTFLKAIGINVGGSMVEEEMLKTAQGLYAKYKNKIILPVDALCATKFEDQKGVNYDVDKIPADYMGLDVGPKTLKNFLKVLANAQTMFWNGPTGVFEFANFETSTKEIALKVVERTKNANGFSLIGGGDTAAAACKFAKKADFSWVSTGGGATLAVIQDDELPGLISK